MKTRTMPMKNRIAMTLAALWLLAGLFALVARAPRARAAGAAEGGAKVSIVDFEFKPAEIAIAAGQSVTWTNNDGAPHGLEFHDGAAGVNPLLPGAAFTRRFDKPGTYEYNCSVHPYMTGRVVVRAP